MTVGAHFSSRIRKRHAHCHNLCEPRDGELGFAALLLNSKDQSARVSRVLLGLAALVMASACSTDRLTGPTPDVERRDGLLSGTISSLTGLLTEVTSVLRHAPNETPIVVSKTFTNRGGELRIPKLGFALVVPADALPGTSLTITVTALRGNAVAYDFAPHGTKFRKPLSFRQDLNGTTGLLGLLLDEQLKGRYFKSTRR